MSLSTIKGKILEYAVRRILLKCGFTPVTPDGLFIYNAGLLQYINGKGAAHDADVLMNPPIQMPFGYPARLLFECKAYNGNIGLPVIRNVAGLREDINAFEIVTEDFLAERRNNWRAGLAIHERKRHLYQVGVASIQAFSKPAQEFAANNKIPLFSLQQTFPQTNLVNLINSVPADFQRVLGTDNYGQLIDALSEKTYPSPERIEELASPIEELAAVFRELHRNLDRVHVGMLESGDLIFLSLSQAANVQDDYFNRRRDVIQYEGEPSWHRHRRVRIHWEDPMSDLWAMKLSENIPSYYFYLPRAIVLEWEKNNRSKESALQLKSDFFSRIFVFRKVNEAELPFYILTIDRSWISQALDFYRG